VLRVPASLPLDIMPRHILEMRLPWRQSRSGRDVKEKGPNVRIIRVTLHGVCVP
jgi:hypothetical protein